MENIDDLMRQKFDSDDPGERFEFREEYWEQAQVLLEQAEEHRRRKLWWFFGLLLLALLLLVWLWWGFGRGAHLSETGGHPHDSSALSVQEGPQPNTVELQSTSGTLGAAATTAQPEEQMPEQSALHPTDKARETEKALAGNNKAKHSGNHTPKSQKEIQIRPAYETEGYGYRQRNLQGKGAQTGAAQSNAAGAPDNAAALKSDSPGSKETVPQTAQLETAPGEGAAVLLDAQTAPKEMAPTPNIPLDKLPTPLKPLALPERPLPLLPLSNAAKEPIATNPKPLKDNPFSFGLAFSGAAYPAQDTQGRWAGCTAGVFGEYHLNPHWTLMLGGQWRFLPGYDAPADSANPIRVENLRYSFGFKSESWQRQTRGLHYLEIPVLARWNHQRWGLEGGAVAGVLMAVQNRTERTTESSLEAAQTIVKKFVRGDKAPYAKRYLSAFVGAEYRFNKRLSLMARGQYRFTPVLIEAPDGTTNKGLGNIELGLRFRIGS